MAKAYYCARQYLKNHDNAQVAHIQMDAYVHIANFWEVWHPIVVNMLAKNENDVILNRILTEITVDGEEDGNYHELGIWIRMSKRGICYRKATMK